MYNHYKYNACNSLNKSNEHCVFDMVNICCYFVYESGNKKPFLSYFLEPNDTGSLLSFPRLRNENLLERVYDYFEVKLDEVMEWKGYKEFNSQLYAFFEFKKIISNSNNIGHNISNNISNNIDGNIDGNHKFKKCLLHEIINVQTYNGMKIADLVLHFFLDNPLFCYLYNNKNDIIEIPIIAFKHIDKERYNYLVYNEILLEPENNYYSLDLMYNVKEEHVLLRYAIFMNDFITFRNLKENEVEDKLNEYNSVILSQSQTIFFTQKSQQLLLL